MRNSVVVGIVLVFFLCGCQGGGNEGPDPNPGGNNGNGEYGTQDRSRYEGDLIFGWVDGSEADMPEFNAVTGGMRPQDGDSREEVVLDQTFTVAAGGQRVFDNRILWIRPHARRDIEIFGRLVIRNCLILWDQTEHQQCRLRIKSGGRLELENTYCFSANTFWVNWEYEDGSTVTYDNHVGNPWCSIWGSASLSAENYSTVTLTFQNTTSGASVTVNQAHCIWFEIFPPPGISEVTLPERRQWSDWDMNDMWPGTTVQVRDSHIYSRDISLSNGTHVTVRDATDGFSAGWSVTHNGPNFITCLLQNMGDPDNDEGVYYADRTWNMVNADSSLRLVNSKLERVWPCCWGNVHMVVRHSNLVDPRVWSGPATMEFYDSTIDRTATYEQGQIYLENCRVRYDIEVKHTGSFVYGYNVTSRDPASPFKVYELDGGSWVVLQNPGVPW